MVKIGMQTQSSAPIYEAIQNYISENNLRCHMPGHLGGAGFRLKEFQQVAAMDVTEVPGLDDLHLPREAISRAQQLMAEAFGAGQSLFLVNGASSGIHSLFLSLPVGAEVVVPRNAHLSFFAGMVLSGAKPHYVLPRVDEETGAALCIDANDIDLCLKRNPDVAAVFITSPVYYGVTSQVKECVSRAHQYGVQFFVDEAHGSHFRFHPDYPGTALQAGADAAVNGFHKTLPVFNQGAVLHLGSHFPGSERVFKAFSLLTTTSPSYPIMASIDLARKFMEDEGFAHLQKAYELSSYYKKKLNDLKGIHCWGEELCSRAGVGGLDPLKITISLSGLSIDGFQMARIMRDNYGVQVELAEPHLVMAMMSIFHNREDWERLFQTVKNISLSYGSTKRGNLGVKVPPAPSVCMSPREAFLAPSITVPLDKCRDRICAEMVAPYPPGIPCLLPGEQITAEVIDYLKYLRTCKVNVQGPQDSSLDNLQVIEDTK